MSHEPKCECCGGALRRAAGPGEWVCPERLCAASGIVVYVPATLPPRSRDGDER